MRAVIIILLVIVLIIIVQYILILLDKDRINDTAEKHGWEILKIEWKPFAAGWIGERNERQYEVIYIDEKGAQIKRICKTSLFTGVYWRDE